MNRTRLTAALLLLLLAPALPAASLDRESAARLGLSLTSAPPIRSGDYHDLLSDVTLHDDSSQRWDGGSTLAHEGTHGANSLIRNRYGGSDKCNALYLGNDLAIVIREPGVPLDTVARYVPANMRGMSWQLYLVDSLQWWQNNTLYLFDEWISYSNGAWAGVARGQLRSSDSQQAAEFTVYAIAAYQATRETKPEYDARQMRATIAWMWERRIEPLLEEPGAGAGARHWAAFMQSAETEKLRSQFAAILKGE